MCGCVLVCVGVCMCSKRELVGRTVPIHVVGHKVVGQNSTAWIVQPSFIERL